MADESIHTDVEHVQPQVTSNDPNERKLARRLRIERRWEVIRRQGLSEELSKEEESNQIQMQVQKSAELLEKFIIEGDEYVTNVRVANDGREVIAEKWTEIQNYNDPLQINEEIASQKEKCDLVIKQKDEIIAMLKDEIKKAEKKFTKDQTKQIEDIDTLAHRIEKQITFMRSAYQKEFELIEEVVLLERQQLIDATNKRWEELYRKRDEQEADNSDKKFNLLKEFYRSMYERRVAFQEKYRRTKIKLENDVETLQRELERIKALAMLNSEKYDYNYQILKKREDENIIVKSQQKRRINKLQDTINGLRRRIADYESSTNGEIKKVRERIKKLHRNILEVEAKADHFAKINDDKFHQVWQMNKKRCEAILKQILDSDRVLYEQQLGISWDPPAYRIDNKLPFPQGYKEGKGDSATSMASAKGRKNEETQYEMVKSTLTSEKLDANPIYKRLVRQVLQHVSDKSGFLTETKLKSILRPYEDERKTLIRLDNAFERDVKRPTTIRAPDGPQPYEGLKLLTPEQKESRTNICADILNNIDTDPGLLDTATLKGTRFESVEAVKAKATEVLNQLTEADFQRCFQQWKSRMERCRDRQGECIEGEKVATVIEERHKSQMFDAKTTRTLGYGNLPLHVLLRIFEHLDEDELRTSIIPVCQQWRLAAETPSLWKTLRFSGSRADPAAICEKIWLYNKAERIHVRNVSRPAAILRQICRCSDNLRHLTLRNCLEVTEDSLRHVLSTCKQLKSLDLKGTPFRSLIFYEELSCLRSLTSLNIGENPLLTLSNILTIAVNCRKLEGFHLATFEPKNKVFLDDSDCYFVLTFSNARTEEPLLRHICLNYAYNFEGVHFQNMWKTLIHLTTLKIRFGHQISDQNVRHLFEEGREAMSNLEVVDFTGCLKIGDEGVRAIANCCSKLRVLNLRSCKNVSSLFDVTKNCKELEMLNIAFCEGLNTDGLLVPAALKVLFISDRDALKAFADLVKETSNKAGVKLCVSEFNKNVIKYQ
ncbi:hypothetical protein NQ318_003008 [Aromia moschata]|uniref:F-box domain-containing protein n=1 Tax=Aromia moschata TaxID=1265417 RepID=A0AAV8YSC0_9CUCU|nr:hypothetical protein NQ318_003008 [Aromia moschata]